MRVVLTSYDEQKTYQTQGDEAILRFTSGLLQRFSCINKNHDQSAYRWAGSDFFGTGITQFLEYEYNNTNNLL